MSFSMPSLKAQPDVPNSNVKNCGEYETSNKILNGCITDPLHPLSDEISGAKASKRSHHLNMTILRNTQGLHAPLRIAMELKAAKKIGRLPFLPSSNIMLETLTGRDIQIGPEDVFNQFEFTEDMGQPHAMVERSLGLL